MPEPTDPDVSLASPLSLLHAEAALPDAQAYEVLFLSFTADLGFLERQALGVAKALGARVTLVADAAMVTPDPRAVRRAGRGYLPGLAHGRGAFHPKLTVIVGPQRLTAAIGSGNLTLAGWSGNDELWTVLRADQHGGPDTLDALAAWLRDLPGAVAFSDHVAEALDRVATRMEGFSLTEPGPTLVTSVSGPIIEQLPVGPVDELAVYAPFYDREFKALTALVDRLQPASLTVGLQPHLTVVDGTALAAALDRAGGQPVELDTSRYRHGKLVEWLVDGQRHALTGSPNCTQAALLQPVFEGGNCELGLIAPTDQSLFPSGAATTTSHVRSHVIPLRDQGRPALLLLGATRSASGVEVLLGRPLSVKAVVEVSQPATPPDVFEMVGEVPADTQRVTVALPLGAGTRLRIRTGADGDEAQISNLVFVVDPERVLHRPGSSTGTSPTHDAYDLFADPGLAEHFWNDLVQLSRTTGESGDTSAATATTRSAQSSGAGTIDWDAYLDQCSGRIGPHLTAFGLGLPNFQADADGGIGAAYEWDDELEDEAAALLEEDTADDLVETDTATPTPVGSLTDRPDRVRRRYRKWSRELSSAAPRLDPVRRLVAVRLLLWTVAAGAWDPDDQEWVPLLTDAAASLGQSEDLPEKAEAPAASLAAVVLSVLRAAVPRLPWTPSSKKIDETAAQLSHLLPAIERERVEDYTNLLADAFGPAVHPAVIDELAAEVVQDDPIDHAIRALEEIDVDAHRHGMHLHVAESLRSPEHTAMQAVAAAKDHDPIAAWAGDSEGWALVIWSRPDVLICRGGQDPGPRSAADGHHWRHHRLPAQINPRTLAERPGKRRATWESIAGHPPDPIVHEMLHAVGLTTPDPPEC